MRFAGSSGVLRRDPAPVAGRRDGALQRRFPTAGSMAGWSGRRFRRHRLAAGAA